MVRKIALTLVLATFSCSFASAQDNTTSTPTQPTLHQDTQLYLTSITSLGIADVSGKLRHKIAGTVTYASSRCVAPGSRCVGLPLPIESIIFFDEEVKATPGVFFVCRRVMESMKKGDKLVMQADFERSIPPVAGGSAKPQLRIVKLTSCFNYPGAPM